MMIRNWFLIHSCTLALHVIIVFFSRRHSRSRSRSRLSLGKLSSYKRDTVLYAATVAAKKKLINIFVVVAEMNDN